MTTKRGEPTIVFSSADLARAAAPFQWALVGKFSQGRPTMEELRKFFKTLDLKAEFSVGLLDHRHVIICLNAEHDFHRIWGRHLWYVLGCPMRVFKWTTSFHVHKEPSLVPVWFSLPKLPLHLFHKECLFHVVSPLGRPLFMDAATRSLSRPSVARVCVEVDLVKPLPSRVWVGLGSGEDDGFWQALVPEKLPHYCRFCFRQGHEESACRAKHPEHREAAAGGRVIGSSGSGQTVKRTWELISKIQREVVGAQSAAATPLVDVGAVDEGPSLQPGGETAPGHGVPAVWEGQPAAQENSSGELVVPQAMGLEAEQQRQSAGTSLVLVATGASEAAGPTTVSGLPTQQVQVLPSADGLVDGKEDAGLGTAAEEEDEVVSDGHLDEEDISMAEQRAGSLSPRGQRLCAASSLVVDIFNLDPIIQQVQEKANGGDDVQLVVQPKRKGVRSVAPTDRSLCSKAKDISRIPNFRRLKRLISEFSIQLVAICEPKVSTCDIQMLCAHLKMEGWMVNREGSIWIFNQNGFQCAPIGESPQHLSLKISPQALSAPVYLSFVHARCTEQDRVPLWSALLADKPRDDPWLVVGDFNTIVSTEEKRGGLPFRVDEGVELSSFMSRAGVFDAASTRLDNKPRPFRFLNVWTSKVELLDVIRLSWISHCPGRPLQRLAAKLRFTKHAIQQWSRDHFGNIFDVVKQAEEAVGAAEAALYSIPTQQQWLALQEARTVLRNSLAMEEAY
nr:uncharacterized protein LOC113689154 [Coffea arabica]